MSQLIRTYSRKGKRVVKDTSASADRSPDRDNVPRKRQKIHIEVMEGADSSSDEDMGGGPSTKSGNDGEQAGSSRRAYRPDGNVTPRGSMRTTAMKHSTSDQASMSRRSIDTTRIAIMKRTRSLASEASPSQPKLRHTQSLSPEKPGSDFRDYFSIPTGTSLVPSVKAGGVAKRMLRRTQTDTSVTTEGSVKLPISAESSFSSLQCTPKKLASTKTESFIDLTTGSPQSTNSRPQTPSKSRSLEDALSPDKITRPSLVNSNIRTYAGKSRSFLIALPTPSVTGSAARVIDGNDQIQEDELEVRESYEDLRARWGVDNSEDDPYPLVEESQSLSQENKGKGKQKYPTYPASRLPPGMMNDLKSITELRSKGESRRFLDEMGYLFEGLVPDGALGVRRGSALEIVSKLCDSEFARKAKAADFLSRAWEGLRAAGAGEGDKVLDTILVLFAALAARDTVDVTDLATRTDFTGTIVKMLSHLSRENDPLWLISCGLDSSVMKSAGISRNDCVQLEGLHKMIQTKSGLIDDSEIVSSRLLASQSLGALPAPMHTSSCLPVVLSSLKAESESLSNRLSAYATGLPLLPALGVEYYTEFPSFSHIDNCLSLFDSFLLGRWEEDDSVDSETLLNSANENGFGTMLVELCVTVDILSRVNETPYRTINGHKCLESAFRVLVNLTHGSLSWCQKSIGSSHGLPAILRLLATCHGQKTCISTTEEQYEENDASHYLDKLCLILGLITNLVQISDEAKEQIHNLKLAPRCPGKRACAVACRCSGAVSAPECLIQIYEAYCSSENDFEPVVRGHLAVLLGLLMRGHPRNQVILLRLLPGPTRKRKLELLMENTREFTLLYTEFIKKAVSATQVEDDDGNIEDRELDVEAAIRMSHGETVVNEVLGFLETLAKSLDD